MKAAARQQNTAKLDVRQSSATAESLTAALMAFERNSLANGVVAESRSQDSAGPGICVAQAAH